MQPMSARNKAGADIGAGSGHRSGFTMTRDELVQIGNRVPRTTTDLHRLQSALAVPVNLALRHAHVFGRVARAKQVYYTHFCHPLLPRNRGDPVSTGQRRSSQKLLAELFPGDAPLDRRNFLTLPPRERFSSGSINAGNCIDELYDDVEVGIAAIMAWR